MSSLISDPRVVTAKQVVNHVVTALGSEKVAQAVAEVIADEFHYGATYYKAKLNKDGLLDYVKLALNEVNHVLTDETRNEVLVDVVAENTATVKMQEIHISEDLT